MPPQTAASHIVEALLSGDPTTIGDALHDGVHSVGAALAQVPAVVIDVIDDAIAANW